MKRLLVFDSHPVQYRVPVWQQINKLAEGSVVVAFATDCSIRGYKDTDFGVNISWDVPMLNSYKSFILNSEHGEPLNGWSSLTGKGVGKLIDDVQPDYILINGINYKYDWVVIFEASRRGIPLWLRCETQDFATDKSLLKRGLRYLVYTIVYRFIDNFFYIGELNKAHYIKHGVKLKQLFAARYATLNSFEGLSTQYKEVTRHSARLQQNISDDKLIIGFSGKFITKKNPEILFEALQYLPSSLTSRIVFYFVGDGELSGILNTIAKDAEVKYGCASCFVGFVNQSEIAQHYLAMDIVVLPSKKMGETWGLVANEGLQAGCGVIVSNNVGCSEDFKSLERFRVFKAGNAKNLADTIVDLSKYQRSFDWASQSLENYSISAVAQAFISKLS